MNTPLSPRAALLKFDCIWPYNPHPRSSCRSATVVSPPSRRVCNARPHQITRIKEKVEEQSGVPPPQQRLIFSGRQMYVSPAVASSFRTSANSELLMLTHAGPTTRPHATLTSRPDQSSIWCSRSVVDGDTHGLRTSTTLAFRSHLYFCIQSMLNIVHFVTIFLHAADVMVNEEWTSQYSQHRFTAVPLMARLLGELVS